MSKVSKPHSGRKHALLSASGASRWINCTPSARLEENFPEKSSSYADEGTLAHELGELEINRQLNYISPNTYKLEGNKIRKNPLFSPDMVGEVEKYVDFVLCTLSEAKASTPDAVILLEERLDFSHVVTGGFGTGDVVIIAEGVLNVIDLKYGKGVKVFAEDNPQLKLYGLGALQKYGLAYGVHTVTLTIVQPRLDNFSTWSITADDLEAWGEEQVKPAAELADRGEGEQKPGYWCKFCKAKPICRALAEQNMSLAKHDFRDPSILSESELMEVYAQIDVLRDWAGSVSAYVLEQALKGMTTPGFKLVEGRSVRKWKDEKEVIKVLSGEYERQAFINESLAGIVAVEKLVGKTDFPALLGPHVIKPPGSPTLVPESDKRPAMGLAQAIKDFAD